MDKKVKVTVTTNGIVTTPVDSTMDSTLVAAAIAPYQATSGAQKIEISITDPI